MSMRRLLPFLLVMILCSSASLAHAADGQNATVQSDTLYVYSSMSESSNVVGSLKKGDAVVVDFEIEKPDGGWCQIRKPDDDEALGYVPCRHLDIEPPAKRYDRLGVKGRGYPSIPPQQSVPTAQKRPYSDIQVTMYMTDW